RPRGLLLLLLRSDDAGSGPSPPGVRRVAGRAGRPALPGGPRGGRGARTEADARDEVRGRAGPVQEPPVAPDEEAAGRDPRVRPPSLRGLRAAGDREDALRDRRGERAG